MIDSKSNIKYESSSNSKDYFSKIIDAKTDKIDTHQTILKASCFDTKLGSMIAISDDEDLYLLEFIDRRSLKKEIERLKLRKKATIITGKTTSIVMIEQELDLYFSGRLKKFKTPIHTIGSDFQKKAWNALTKIPYGQTRSYLQQAKTIGKELAFRAVANANGVNQLAIVIPCHRIINSNGSLGGYGGGKIRKEWLINHERQHA